MLDGSSFTIIRRFGRPKTFNEMFLFNAAVMGFGNSGWMHLVLEQRLGSRCVAISGVMEKELEKPGKS